MNVQYDLSDLAAKYGFNVREIEKTCRVANILRDISQVDFLRNRLSLYGGTALNFLSVYGVCNASSPPSVGRKLLSLIELVSTQPLSLSCIASQLPPN